MILPEKVIITDRGVEKYYHPQAPIDKFHLLMENETSLVFAEGRWFQKDKWCRRTEKFKVFEDNIPNDSLKQWTDTSRSDINLFQLVENYELTEL